MMGFVRRSSAATPLMPTRPLPFSPTNSVVLFGLSGIMIVNGNYAEAAA